jgi:16S rRNA (guanine966-N2)-methyltransferase
VGIGRQYSRLMRVIAGTWGGRRLQAPPGAATRPTSDRVREALFSVLGDRIAGARVLDLFAGSGALGLEALSRGAASATFIESDREACRTINANLDKLKLHATVLCQDVVRALAQERRRFDLVLCDPPYGFDQERLAPHLARLLNEDGLLVWETAGREPPPAVPGLSERTSRRYGSARLTLFEL